jgi:ferredoxin like protein
MEGLSMTVDPLDVTDFEARMASATFDVASEPHIVVDGDACEGCTTRACVTVCPAGLFVELSTGGVAFNYEQCFECGSCYLVCNDAGAITWRYPEGGKGVIVRRG